MKLGFIIMQIGNQELDQVCEKAIVPALKSCGFDPKRVDKHNVGRLLKSEIVGFIKSAEIIVADLTNKRPNCYLEVGYAMGLDKFQNLILTAREDHSQNSPNYRKDGPRIHFDLSGYDILFWDKSNLEGFEKELEKRIRRRLQTLPLSMKTPSAISWDTEWMDRHHRIAWDGLMHYGKQGYMTIEATLTDQKLSASQVELLRAAKEAQIDTFGWPIGIVLSDERKPKPITDGIFAEIKLTTGDSYDYWAIRTNGDFYLLKSLFEDERSSGVVFFNTRTVRITESLLYLDHLYTNLKVPSNGHVAIRIEHGGLENRVLTATPPRDFFMVGDYRSKEKSVTTMVETTLDELRSDLASSVEKFTKPLFVVFDFFELNRKVLKQIVDDFAAGKVT
jgi:hypothetical protein